ncbi:SfnB family sulfur acquisition oxidoreductase [Nocardia sp. NPDC004415]
MTVVTAERITTAAQALAIATELAEEFRQGAAERDHARRLPHQELDRLSASGLLAITVPAAFGGAELAPSVVAEVVRILAGADPNIAQIPHSHFVYLNLLRLAGSPALRHEIFTRVLAGARIANAQSERGGATVAEIGTVLRPVEGRFVIDGTKFYCTGSLFADLLAVLTRLDDPQGVSGLAPGEYVAFVAAAQPGVRIVDDWDALGQRTTGSGTVAFESVGVDPAFLVARAAAVAVPTGYGAFAQLLHAAIDAGIARGALEAAAEFVRTQARPWFEAEVTRAVDDPLVVQRFGELGVAVAAAEATLTVAGAAVDEAVRVEAAVGQASIVVATAKVLADRAANEVSAAVFEVGGTRSAAATHRLDHFWRNARTHTLHDPVRWKYQHIGRAVLHDRPPPLHGVI